MESLAVLNGKHNYSHVAVLICSFFIVSNFFNIVFVPNAIAKMIHWIYDVLIICYGVDILLKRRLSQSVLSCMKIPFLFIGIVTLSFFTAMALQNQSFLLTIRLVLPFYEYFFILILFFKKVHTRDIYLAVSVFSVIWMIMWVVGFLSPMPLYDASGEFDESLMSSSRGVVRLKIAGSNVMKLWGMWSLGLYISSFKKKYLFIYALCMLFVVLLVSRQHIVYYFLCGFLSMVYYISNSKKILSLCAVTILLAIGISQTTIYKNLEELTKSQMEANDGGKDDIRINAAKYFISEFPNSAITVILGNGVYHSESQYGKRMYFIGRNYGYFLSDIGYVQFYIFFGLIGIGVLAYLLWYIVISNVPLQFIGIKLYFYFLFMGSVFSHAFDTGIFVIAIAFYLLLIGRLQYKVSRKRYIQIVKL